MRAPTPKAQADCRPPMELQASQMHIVLPARGSGNPATCRNVVTQHGVNVYAGDPDPLKHQRIVRILDQYHVWKEKGCIRMREEDKMPVDLIDGWQHAKIRCAPYPVGLKDRAFLDDTLDAMHDTNKLDWQKEATPFACPVFVAWRTTVSGTRRRVSSSTCER